MQNKYYPLTHAQKRIWYTEHFYPGINIANLSGFAKLKSETGIGINCNLLIDAIREVVRINDTLRLKLAFHDGIEPSQYFSDYQEFEIELFDFRQTENVGLAEEWGRAEAGKPFVLFDSELFKFAVFRISNEESWFFAKLHHVIADGVSIVLLANQIIDIYLQLANQQHESHNQQPSYADYIHSELEYNQSERFQKDKKYWNEQFASLPQFTSLKRNESYRIRPEADRFSKVISENLQKDIQIFCKENNISVLALFLSIMDIYMRRATGEDDVVVGTFMANRTTAKEKQMLGMFASTIPIRTHVNNNLDFLTFARQKMKDLLTRLRHQKYPYNVLVNDLRESHANINRLFGISLEYQVMQWNQKDNIVYLTEPLFSGNELNDVSIHVKERWDTAALTIDFDYRTELFSVDEIDNLYQSIMTLLADALAHPLKTIGELEICSDEEKQRQFMQFNNPKLSYPKGMTLHELFEEQAVKTPQQAAVVYEDKQITYKELNERATRLGHVLRDRGVVPDSRVAVLMERSEKVVTAIMGVLKAGGAYVPIDPDFPEERIRFILQDAGVKQLITEQHLFNRYDLPGTETLMFDEVLLHEDASGNSPQAVNPNHLAYTIYTSGTTGKPKGVMIEHRQVHQLIEGLRSQVYAEYDTCLNVALVAPFHFDASVQQIFASLLLGHTLYIVPKSSVTNGRALADYYRCRKIHLTDGTPAHLQMLLAGANLDGVALRHMLIGGEALPYASVRALLDLFAETGSEPKITNVYGPTECCVDASAFDIVPTQSIGVIESPYVSIGKPLGNNRLYILDAYGRPQPMGIAGELYIAGDGVGRGYLNLPELTAEKFVADPFVAGETMYKTGDLARWLPDGNVEFLARMDNQVKIRGYRIELGEIETVLQTHSQIRKAVVLARSDEQKRSDLCAYVLCNNSVDVISVPDLRAYLAQQLPSYMIPSYFVQLDEIPLTSSGKVDRKVLLRLEVAAVSGRDYVPPATEFESQLAQIWQDVLGLKRVGVYDNFFELGGHSLKAMLLLSRIHKECGVEVPIDTLFETPTINAIARYVSQAAHTVFRSIEPATDRDFYPLTPSQQRVYIVSEFQDAGITYNMPGTAIIEGSVDIQQLENAFQELIKRHDTLRTSFVSVDGVPMQQINDHVPFEIALIQAGEDSAESIMASFVQPFDLRQPLMRAGLMQLAEDRYMLLVDMHHMVSDGVSIGIILSELAKLYAGEQLPALRLQYKDYAVWQSAQLISKQQPQEEYWLTAMSGELPVLQLLTDYPRPPLQRFEGDMVSVVVDQTLKTKLNQLAEENGSTLYMVLLGAYYLLLSRYTGQEDIIVGTPTAGRNHPDLEGIVGMFVNTLPIRLNIDRESTFLELLHNVRRNVLSAFEHQDYPFESLVEKLNLPRDLSRNPIFNTMVILQNSFNAIPDFNGMQLSIHESNLHIAKFDLTFQAKEETDHITVDVEYSTSLYRRDTIERMLGHFVNILQSIAAEPLLKLGQVSLLAEEEKQQLLIEFNPPATEYPKQKTIVQIFEEQAANMPDRVALVFEGAELTYADLNRRVNQLARTLLDKGVENGEVVAVLVDRSVEMVAGIMAILKVGAAYVPIDPEHPLQRIKYFLADSGASVLVTQHSLQHLTEELGFVHNHVFADDVHLYQGDTSNLQITINPDNLANLTYTSGTTGNPKGNMVTHTNILRTVKCSNYMQVANQDIVLSISNYVFDAFMFDIFGALLNGAKLVLIPKQTILDISSLPQVIERERITILMITTALFNLLVDVRPDCLSGMRKILFGGERASVDHVRKALEVTGKGKLLHMYGPSESTVFATYYPVDEVAEDALTIPIGKPISNTSVFILNAFNQLQQIGAAGELCVGGDGLVFGYFNRQELTSDKFIPNPFAENERLYRTGDLARWLPDGNIEFIGRIDHQVKIRGQRIELGEIEHQMLRHESIREAVVLTVEAASGETLICGYIVTDAPLSNSELREHAGTELPAYMIPFLFIQLAELPLTSNGKIDRRALPKPDLSAESGVEYVAARDATEAKLVDIWQTVLGVEQVGIHDNFFELGGHSLKAMSLAASIQQAINVDVPLRVLFQSPTIAALAEFVSTAETNHYIAIDKAEVRDFYPVTSAQKRLYVLQQLEGVEQSYNMPAMLRLQGPLKRERFEAAIKALVQRHTALRTSFETVEGEPVQRVHAEADFAVSYMQAKEEEAERIISEFIRPFQLKQASLLRIGLVRFEDEHHLLMFDMHHIISDGASVSVLIDELTKLYAGETLSLLPVQYTDYAVWQQSFLQTQAYRKQETYWLQQFADAVPVLTLPTDYTRPAIQSFAGDRLTFTLDPDLTQALHNLAHETETTLYMVLLASYSSFLARLSGQDDIVVGSPIVGRPHPDLTNIIGMFVNTLAMRTYPQADKTFMEYLQEVKQTALGAYECQDYPFEELVGKVQIQRDMSRNPLFDVVFTLQNADPNLLSMEGISLQPYDFQHKTAKFDLTLSAAEEQETIKFEMEYNTALFEKATVERWIGYFSQLLRHVAAEPGVTLAKLNMLSELEKHQILFGFNDTQTNYPREKTTHQLFEEQVDRTPDNLAVVFGNQQITYLELNEQANRLARTLRAKGVQPDDVVGISVEQSVEMVVGIMAILKAGGAYLPIDLSYPEERVRYLMEDSGTALVLTQQHFAHRLHAIGDRMKAIDLLFIDEPSQEVAVANLEPVNGPHNLAYVIYTSGSTGQPKGVMVEHRNVMRLVKNAGYIPFTEQSKMAQTGAISFDATTFELFGALLHGACLYPVPKDILLDVMSFTEFLRQQQITTMWLTAPLFNQLAQDNPAMFVGLQHLIIGGDALAQKYVNQVRRECPGVSLWNGYGPTENTTFSTCFLIDKEYEQIPIGKPIGNSTAYIVNSRDQLQPVGVPGELCVGGDGVARGYLHLPDLTKLKFVDNPFVSGERMYRTGDLARWLPDGNIEFLGRIDNQVKVRGYRIETGEVESQLQQVNGVNEAVVIVRQDEAGANYLCAYVVGQREFSTADLRTALSTTLPAYMIPSHFVQVAKLPLTANGKVDRKVLPEPAADAGKAEYTAPRNEREELLSEIWQDVLGISRVGIEDNFFSLGGDSIKAIQMAARLNKLGWKLEMKDLFQHPTIEQVSIYLQLLEGEQANQAPVAGEVRLTPIQNWFFERRFSEMHHWNQSVMLHASAGFDPQLVAKTLAKLAEQHDALRMVYVLEEERIVQINRSVTESVVGLEVISLDVPSGELEQAILRESERVQASIDLSHGPLMKAALFPTQQGDYLLIVIHHLVIDGVSWRILLEDFASGYAQAEKGQPIQLPDKTHSYQEWAIRLKEYADSKNALKEIEYWSGLENTGIVPLPKHYQTDDHTTQHTQTAGFALTANETKDLTTRVHLAYNTEMNDILLSALGLAVQEWVGHDQLLVTLEGHGREEIIEEINISRTVGWFTTQYPVLLDMSNASDIAYQIKRTKEDLRHIPNKGIGYGILRYLTTGEHKSALSFSSAPDISFNYLGQFTETDGSGLFTRSSVPTGNPLSPKSEKAHPIDVVGFIEGGVLSMTFAYNSLEYDAQTIVLLSQGFKNQLLNLMEHCLHQTASELTPSDLGDNDLTLEELDKLLQML